MSYEEWPGCHLAIFPLPLYISFIVMKSGKRSLGTEATHGTFESLNNCIGSSEALVNQEMPSVHRIASGTVRDSGEHHPKSGEAPLIKCLSISQHFCCYQSMSTCSLKDGLSAPMPG